MEMEEERAVLKRGVRGEREKEKGGQPVQIAQLGRTLGKLGERGNPGLALQSSRVFMLVR